MSIASEITRLQNAKDDLRTAIQAKGVTVPATAKLDDYDTYVASISITPTLQAKTATPSTSQQVITPDYNYQGLSQVTVSAVTSAIDADIVAGNIKSGVNILGVTGTYTGDGGGGSATVATTTTTVGNSNASSISFTVSGQPKMFAVQVVKNSGSYLTNSSSTRYITSVISNWTTVYSTSVMYNSSSGSRQAREYVYTTCSKSYSTSGNTKTLTITTGSTSTSGYFVASTEYRLIYIY